MTTKVKRRPAAAVKYHWFQGASVRELYDRLTAAGPVASTRLEVRISGDKMTLEVVGETQSAQRNPPINDSRVCPPICP